MRGTRGRPGDGGDPSSDGPLEHGLMHGQPDGPLEHGQLHDQPGGQLDHGQLELAHHAAIARLAVHALCHDTSLTELVRRSLTELRELVPCTAAAVLLVDGDHLQVRVAAGDLIEGQRFPLRDSICEQALQTGALTRLDDALGDPLPRAARSTTSPGPVWAVPIGVYSRLRLLVCIGEPESRCNPMADASVQAIAGIIAGAAERHAIDAEVRATEQRFRRLAENVPDAVFRVRLHPDVRLDYVSPRMAELTGLSPDQLTDRAWAWQDIVPAEDRHVVADLDLTGTEVIVTEPYRIVRPDGTTRWVETRLNPERDPDGQVVAVSGISVDITARREADEVVRRTLVREQQASDQLRRLAELKNALLAAVSHELRTPLTAVMGFAEVLRTTGDDLEPIRRDRALAALERNAHRLEHLLTDLLDLDRLDRGVVEPVRRPVDLAMVVDDVIDRLEQQQPADIEVSVLPRILNVDPAKIERVVENLVVNAIKHTPPGCHVWVSCQDVDGGVLLSVQDDGPGVPDELKSLVFEPFERGDASSPAPGTGIGLSLVRRFVELHGGAAWIEDRDGGGSAFNVWLPDVDADPDPADVA